MSTQLLYIIKRYMPKNMNESVMRKRNDFAKRRDLLAAEPL